MKSIEQLVELSSNPYYTFSAEESKALSAFLSKQSEQTTQAKSSGKKSEKNIPATVINKNRVQKETGEIPTVDNVMDKQVGESEAVEDSLHPDAVK